MRTLIDSIFDPSRGRIFNIFQHPAITDVGTTVVFYMYECLVEKMNYNTFAYIHIPIQRVVINYFSNEISELASYLTLAVRPDRPKSTDGCN